MGRQDVAAIIIDRTALLAAHEEIEQLRQAQKAVNRHLSRLAKAAHGAVWREMNEMADIIAWRDVETRHDFFVEFEALCAMAGLAEKTDPAPAHELLKALRKSIKRLK